MTRHVWVWTEPKKADAIRLRASGLSFTEIGRRMKTSRCAVAGMFYRLANPAPKTSLPSKKEALLALLREPHARIEIQRAGYSTWLLRALIEEGAVHRMSARPVRDFYADLPGKPLYLYVTKTSTTVEAGAPSPRR